MQYVLHGLVYIVWAQNINFKLHIAYPEIVLILANSAYHDGTLGLWHLVSVCFVCQYFCL